MNNFLSKYLNALLNAPKIDVALFTFHIYGFQMLALSLLLLLCLSLSEPLNIFSRWLVFKLVRLFNSSFICLHFSRWNFSNQVLLQFSRFSKSSWKISLSSPSVMFLKILVSSANRYIRLILFHQVSR